jgi:uncharacterized membrane protein (DUF2068 family)
MDSRHQKHHLEALRAIALVELSKGVLVLLLGFGVISVIHHGDLWDLVENVLDFLHVNLDSRPARFFLDLADRLSDVKLWTLASVASVYSSLRFVEAYGLWFARPWAEWLAAISGMIYLPFELYEVFRRPTSIHFLILVINVGIVVYMLYLRLAQKKIGVS